MSKKIHSEPMMYVSVQRYDFESNSQRHRYEEQMRYRCMCLCKDTILKAIHNLCGLRYLRSLMYVSVQRYDFESNSQPGAVGTAVSKRCMCLCKDTILKAIHNNLNVIGTQSLGVCVCAKIRF